MEHLTKNRKPPELSFNQQAIEDLSELISALDRRVPRLERDGEENIARDAAALRREALDRIGELRRSGADE
jgi:hypothetical protein